MNKSSDRKLLCSGLLNHGIHQGLIVKSAGAPQRVLNECRAKSACKPLSPVRDDVAHFENVLKCRPLMKAPGRINGPRFNCFSNRLSQRIERLVAIFSSPLSDRIKIFESKTNRINFTMATGALRLLLMSLDTLARRENLAGKAVELRNISRRGRRWIVEQFPQDPRSPFNGARVLAVPAHGKNRPPCRLIRLSENLWAASLFGNDLL